MKRAYRILFLSQPATGHVNPLLTIALQMRSEGHYVRFLIPGRDLPFRILEQLAGKFQMLRSSMAVPDSVASYGIEVDLLPVPLMVSLRSIGLPYATGYQETRFAMDLMNRGVGVYTRFLLDYLSSHDFDVIVSDFTLTAGHVAAEKKGIPCAVVFQAGLAFRGKGIPPFASGLPIGDESSKEYERCVDIERIFLNRLDRRLARVRRQWGLPDFPEGFLRTPYSRWLNLALTSSAIEAPRSAVTESTFFVGPCFQKGMDRENDFPFHQLQKSKYKVYVSLGSVFNNKPDVFRTIIRALDHTDYQVIISAVNAYHTLSNDALPENVLLFSWVPQGALLEEVDLVISHGGNGTTNDTLAAGKPLIVIPVGGEHGDNARRVEYLGVGLRVALQTMTSEDISESVRRIREDRSFKDRADELKREIDKTDGPRTASKLIELLAETGQPLKRPSSVPLTVTSADYAIMDTFFKNPDQERK